ncbi:SAF domain-containing protein [Streptacidiphilus anmyonensis]|uniref:SAF domain-containing protein n=1 Tax=Streptacidiphilus anmyonensis TaxID=405782 RepID=UPI0005A7FEA7|nr:SAF domain-containing protein [Streptacidiphilus anmyonensis]
MAVIKPRQPVEQGLGPVPITTSAPRRARRPMLAAAGAALAVVGALGAYAMVHQAGDRVPVLALAHMVPKGQVLTTGDLMVAQVAPDPALAPVPSRDASQVLGKTALTDLTQGSLLTRGSVASGPDVTAGKTVVGVLAKPGQLPAGMLEPGSSVQVVQTPAQGDSKVPAAPMTVLASVVSVGPADAGGNSVVDLAVNPGDAPQLAAWAAVGQVAITLQSGPVG